MNILFSLTTIEIIFYYIFHLVKILYKNISPSVRPTERKAIQWVATGVNVDEVTDDVLSEH
jgi:hypothetical protein